MKYLIMFIVVFGWFYLRRRLRKTSGNSFPWVDWFLGIMIGLYGFIMLLMAFGVEQKRAGLLAIGFVVFGVFIVLSWLRWRIKSKPKNLSSS